MCALLARGRQHKRIWSLPRGECWGARRIGIQTPASLCVSKKWCECAWSGTVLEPVSLTVTVCLRLGTTGCCGCIVPSVLGWDHWWHHQGALLSLWLKSQLSPGQWPGGGLGCSFTSKMLLFSEWGCAWDLAVPVPELAWSWCSQWAWRSAEFPRSNKPEAGEHSRCGAYSGALQVGTKAEV